MYQFKNWKLICEEKDREIARLKEELERVKRVERLTKRELVNEKHVGCNIEIGQMNSCPDCNDSCMYGRCKWQEKANRKLKEYEDLEEQGLLLKPPCKIGDDVYFIPSKVNYKLNILNGYEENNRVYHQKVVNITFTTTGCYITCDKDMDFGTCNILVDIFFKETWFLSEAEAEKALAEMEK